MHFFFEKAAVLLGLGLLALQPSLAAPACNNQCYHCPSVLRLCPGNINLNRVCHDTRRFPRTQRPPCTTTAIKTHKVTIHNACTRTRTATKYSPTRTVTWTRGPVVTKTSVVATRTVSVTVKETYVTTITSTITTIDQTLTWAASPTPRIINRAAAFDISAACYCHLGLAPKKTVVHYKHRKTIIYKPTKTRYQTKTICKPTTKTITRSGTVTKGVTSTITKPIATTTTTLWTTTTFLDHRPTTTTIFPPPTSSHCPISDVVAAPFPLGNEIYALLNRYSGSGFTTPYMSNDTSQFRYRTIFADSVCEAVFVCAANAGAYNWPSFAVVRYYDSFNNWWGCHALVTLDPIVTGDNFVTPEGNPLPPGVTISPGTPYVINDRTRWNIPNNRVREAHHYAFSGKSLANGFSLFGITCQHIPQPGITYHQSRYIAGYTLNDRNIANPPGAPAPISREFTTNNGCEAVRSCAEFARNGGAVVYKSFNVWWDFVRGVWVCRAMFGRASEFAAFNVFNYNAVVSYGFESYPDGR
ncbi:hypothetical protein DRE_01550 [Drechslerella stenobrocha 248]|uniref:Uncharacterized protein n=1 Tax=Drechslerella stenobrocha 248 TaxID=1043628 RepID=W7HUZ5_9PEZI|nr:hypothetical protein DRE_01550 [Drechslerella stenobrocha 248]